VQNYEVSHSWPVDEFREQSERVTELSEVSSASLLLLLFLILFLYLILILGS
jgi:hypothetical protein